MARLPLEGLIVVDLSTGIPGAYATRLLADAGASVTASPPEPAAGLSRALGLFLLRDKRVLARADANQLAERLDAADVVVVGGDQVDPSPLARRHPTQVVVAVTPYGLDGPWAGRPTSDLVLQAESGSLATRGLKREPPLMAGGRTNDFIAGAFAAAGAVAAWWGSRRTGQGELIDVSVLEAAHVAGTSYGPLGHLLAGSPEITRPARVIETPEIHPSLDGWVGFTANSGQQFQDFLVLIDRADLAADEKLATVGGRQARYDEWTAIVDGWTSTRTTAEIVEAASLLRIPSAPVLDAASMLDFAQFRSRQVFRRSEDDSYAYPRRPWMVHEPDDLAIASPPPSDPPLGALPLDGIKVVDMTAWWAGPTATHLLGCLGAEVVHVEAPTRPDGMRMTGGSLRRLGQWWERSSFFLSVNSGKRDLAVELGTPEGMEIFERLVAEADVLVENFTPRVLDNLGLSWSHLQTLNPRLVVVRMPAFGLDGPWRDRPGFAQTMEQLSGLAWLTGWAEGQPHNQRGPCDPNGGVHAAFGVICALAERERDGRGRMIEVPFIEVALNAAAEQIVEHSLTGTVPARDGNRSPTAAPQGVYACPGDEQWLALSVEDDEQWLQLRKAIGWPAWADDPALGDHDGRRRAHDAIDEHLAGWAASVDLDDAVETLVQAGVPAGAVRDPRTCGDHPQLEARRFYETLDHPVVGRQPFSSLPLRYASVDRWLRSPAPTMGQHNREILRELGYDGVAIDRLDADGVIGTRIPGIE